MCAWKGSKKNAMQIVYFLEGNGDYRVIEKRGKQAGNGLKSKLQWISEYSFLWSPK